MKSIFTGTYEQLREKLNSINGEWDETQANKKVLRLNGGVMNWYENTGTIQFQGKDEPRSALEYRVLSCINPNHQPKIDKALEEVVEQEEQTIKIEEVVVESIGKAYLNGRFENSEIVIGIVSAVGTETLRVITPLRE